MKEVFRACRNAIPVLIERRRKERRKRHKAHIAKNPSNSIYVLFGECKQCKKEKLTSVKPEDVLKAIKRELKKLYPKYKDPTHPLPDIKTIDNHLFPWMMLHHHPKWVNGRIPKNYCKRILPEHVKVFSKYKILQTDFTDPASAERSAKEVGELIDLLRTYRSKRFAL